MPLRHTVYRSQQFAAVAVSLAVVLVLLATSGRSLAAPITGEQALETTYAWLNLSPEVMHARHGQLAGTIVPVTNALGEAEFYAVDLAPKGYVVVAADDTVEPIIAFSTKDVFEAAPGQPLFDMLRSDIPARIARGRARDAATPAKWEMLRALANAPKVLKGGSTVCDDASSTPSGVSDVRVAPLVKSQWDQLTSYGLPVYNYYTPPYAAGNTSNYYTGCVATMLGQIMRFHQWPQDGVGTASYQITVEKAAQKRALRGGDGAGGSYSWADMPLTASADMPTAQQQAISALLADAGVASNMDYEPDGSGAVIGTSALINAFHYANAAFSSAKLSSLETAIDANLDAGLPVGLGINGNGVGHAVVADGYGYNATTLYHHLNMGWGGANDAWYNLPTVNVGFYDFTVVNGALFNIDPAVRGEIISGRVADSAGNPVAGAQVTAVSGATVLTATTNAVGIYAMKGIPSNSTWTITPSANGWSFTPANLPVTTGYSTQNGGMGDRTGLNFTSKLLTGSVSVDINAGAVASGAQWRVNGGAWQVSGVTVVGVPIGTGTFSFRATSDWVAPANEPVSVAENQTTSVTATYYPQYSLTAVPDNAEDGQVKADPPPRVLGSYPRNTTVTLTATAATGYYFSGWVENGVLVSTSSAYSTVVKSARHLVANFPPDTLTGVGTQVYVTSNRTAATIDALGSLNDASGTPAILSVTQPVAGTVIINPDGTLTFTPGKNFHGSAQFSYTAGDGTGTIRQTVTMLNWFAASAGNYTGLSMASDVTNETSGYLKITLTASGAFTGKLSVAGIAYALSGVFDGNANYQKVVLRKNASNLNVNLHVVPASEITGTIGDGSTLSSISAQRGAFGNTNKAPQAGKYAMLLSGNSAVPGNGFLSITIGTTGGLTAAGRLADGTPVAMGACLNADGTVPYYTGVYGSATGAGSVLGTMSFQSATGVECTGTYAWFRPATTGLFYPGGFSESGSLAGSSLEGVTNEVDMQSEQVASIGAELSGGGLAGTITEAQQTFVNGKLSWISPGAGNLIITVAKSGQVTGSFIDPGTGKKRLVLGMWLQYQQFGGGYFLGDGVAGAVTLSGS